MELTFPLLTADQIEVKVKQIGKPSHGKTDGAVSLLMYKTARTDMDMLDAAVGPMRWQSDYKEIKGNLYCGIGIDGVWKWDCGTESRTDGDGNEKKGEASDAFKRAGFKWGIGRELYTSPRITAFLPVLVDGNKVSLKERHHKYDGFTVQSITYEGRSISSLSIADSKGNVVFAWKSGKGNVTPRNSNPDNTPQSPEETRAEIEKTRARREAAADNVGGSVTVCEKCGKPIKGFKQGSNAYKSTDVMAWSREKFGKNLCYRCYVDECNAGAGG